MHTSLLTSEAPVRAELLKFCSFLENQKEDLLREWLRSRRQANRKAFKPGRSSRVWIDHLPDVLEEVIQGLPPGEEADEDASRVHALQRCHQGFSADESVFDLHILGQILREQLRIYISGNPRIDTETVLALSRGLSETLEQLVGESVKTFFQVRNNHQRLREQIFKRKLQALSEEISGTCEAVDGYSHDLKGCTDTLIQLTEFIRGKLGNEADALLSSLACGLQYNHKILADLEALSRDPVHTDPADLDLSELARDIWRRLAFPGSPARKMPLQWLTSDEVRLRADALALERILSNLIDNAIQHGAPGQEIRIGCWNDPEGSVRFEIENQTGTGVPQPAGANGDWTPDAVFASEGTGICVVRNLVRELDGELWFQRCGGNRVRARVRIQRSTDRD
ncbi:MAG: sensor histidine kinase [Verrucomicrobia bacterium]|nr:sensor histidine kinase [Verrucomicrobiota bacterium]MCH8527369.1 sensor histidine kinase [Kiritimatiellia bacterium]